MGSNDITMTNILTTNVDNLAEEKYSNVFVAGCGTNGVFVAGGDH